MSARKQATIVGVFHDRVQADKAVAALQAAGFSKDHIGVAMRHGDHIDGTTSIGEGEESGAASGATVGALTGLGLGALAGLGVLAGVIPVVGPAIAAGTLGIVLSNAAAGAGIAGLVGALVGAGLPEDEAKYYHDEFEAGRVIVTVNADGNATQAGEILQKFGAYDMKTRDTVAAQAPATSTSATASRATSAVSPPVTAATKATSTHSATPHTATAHAASSHVAGDTIEVKEERLHATTKPVETGEVRVRKEVHTETKTLEVPVTREEVVIERTAVSGRATSTGINSDDLRVGQEIRIPVSEEQVSVTKDAVVTEEVKVGKKVIHDTEKVSGQVRKEEVKVEQTGDVDVRTSGTGKTKGH